MGNGIGIVIGKNVNCYTLLGGGMAQTQDDLTVRIDSDVRASAEVFFNSYGLNLSTAGERMAPLIAGRRGVPREIAIKS
jgi:antitoxin component of RelBE/YafQ-DinJ toxin-antitoxin module